MSDSGRSRSHWALFAGGVLVGSAAAAGVAYATTQHYLAAAEAAKEQLRRTNASTNHGRSPRSPQQPQQQLGRAARRSGPAANATAGSGLLTPSTALTFTGRPGTASDSRGNGLRTNTPVFSTAVGQPRSPRVEWLAREDVDHDDSNQGPQTIADGWRMYEDMTGDSNPASRRQTADQPSRNVSGTLGEDGHRMAVAHSLDTFWALPPADRANHAAMETLRNPSLHVMPAAAQAQANGGGNSTAAANTHKQSALLYATAAERQMMDSGKAIELQAMQDDYCRVITPEAALNEETEEVCAMLLECLDVRKKWLFHPSVTASERMDTTEDTPPSNAFHGNAMQYHPLPPSDCVYDMRDGVIRVYQDESKSVEMFPVPGTMADFFTDMHRILRYASIGPVKSYAHHRLMLLEQKFNLHVMLNADKEFLAQKSAPHRDFYNVRKVDTHIHHSACMHQKHLLRFIKSKLRKEPDEVVIFRDGKYLTLAEVFQSLKLTGYDLNVDTLDMHADKNTFHRFDKFNLKYNPCGQSRLREIFIKQDNLIHGRFLAELTQEVFSDIEASKYQHAEMRISVYGRKQVEWDILAAWVVGNKLYSDNVVWLIQVPRLYNLYKETGIIENFQQMLENLFVPLFEATADPSSHPQLHVFLSQVVGFDMVDDESKPERRPTKHSPLPAEWNSKHNAAYSYYCYFIYANLLTLNKFRESRGLNTFSFRPHAGEAGDTDHLVSAFMLCENIAHGINLRKSPCLQYLFYLSQIGLCMSPLSNNSLFLDYHRNPFPAFFARGLSVSLSTDDPLQIHLTKEPLVEEYSVAAQVWKLSSTDLCEVARNGVLQSGFSHSCKKHWVAEQYWRPGPDGNDIQKTNVPNLRMRFRQDTYIDEMRLVVHGALAHQSKKIQASRAAESPMS